MIIEHLLEERFPVLIIDTDGEYYGLKEKYEVLYAGADEECDLQIGPEHADHLAKLALEKNLPVIVDVFGFIESEEAKDIIEGVARSLYNREKKLQ